MKIVLCLAILAALCLFGGIVASLWVPAPLACTVLGSGIWSAIGFGFVGGIARIYQVETEVKK